MLANTLLPESSEISSFADREVVRAAKQLKLYLRICPEPGSCHPPSSLVWKILEVEEMWTSGARQSPSLPHFLMVLSVRSALVCWNIDRDPVEGDKLGSIPAVHTWGALNMETPQDR